MVRSGMRECICATGDTPRHGFPLGQTESRADRLLSRAGGSKRASSGKRTPFHAIRNLVCSGMNALRIAPTTATVRESTIAVMQRREPVSHAVSRQAADLAEQVKQTREMRGWQWPVCRFARALRPAPPSTTATGRHTQGIAERGNSVFVPTIVNDPESRSRDFGKVLASFQRGQGFTARLNAPLRKRRVTALTHLSSSTGT